jgi:hypothetical protein
MDYKKYVHSIAHVSKKIGLGDETPTNIFKT